MSDLVANLPQSNKIVLRRLVVLLLNTKKKGLDIEQLLKKTATCMHAITPSPSPSMFLETSGAESHASQINTNGNISSNDAYFNAAPIDPRSTIRFQDTLRLSAMYTSACEIFLRSLMMHFMDVFGVSYNSYFFLPVWLQYDNVGWHYFVAGRISYHDFRKCILP